METAFIAPADHNYLLARLAFLRGMAQAGYFEAAQALEKYLKASLLLNGNGALQGHNFRELLEAHQIIWPDALDYEIFGGDLPEGLARINRPHGDTIAKFIGRLALYGSTDNRYTRDGYVFDYLELTKLDQVLFLVRGTCRTVDGGDTKRAWRLGGHLPIEGWSARRDEPLSIDFFEGNGVWLSALEEKGVTFGRQPMLAYQASAIQSALMMVGDDPAIMLKAEFFEWLLKSVHFNSRDRKSILAEIARLRTISDSEQASR